jgi:phage protein D
VSEHGALKTEIKLDGSTTVSGDAGEVKLKDGAHVTRIQVDQRLDAPDFFSLTLQSMSQEKMIMVDSAKPGMKVEILLGYDTSVSIFEGEVTYLEPSFSDKRQEITLSGYDYTHRLTRGTNSRAFGDGHKANDKISAVIQKVVGDSGGRKSGKADGSNNLAVTASGDDVKFEYVPQVEVNDYQFMKSLGGVSGATIKPVAKDSKKVEFKPTVTSGNATLVICRDNPDPPGSALARRADFRLSTVHQVARVEVRGWDPKKKESILGVAEALDSGAVDGEPGHQATGKAHFGAAAKGHTMTIVDVPVASKSEAEAVAKSVFDGQAMDFLSADVEIEGDPEVAPGAIVELKQFGTRYSGKYVVEAAHHVYVAAGKDPYIVRLHLVRNSAPSV